MLHGLNYTFLFKAKQIEIRFFFSTVNSLTNLSFLLIITREHLWEYHPARVRTHRSGFFFLFLRLGDHTGYFELFSFDFIAVFCSF